MNTDNLHSNHQDSNNDASTPDIQAPAQPKMICPSCNLKVTTHELAVGKNAHCPKCDTQLYRTRGSRLELNLLIAISGLLLFIPTIFLPYISIRLINVNFHADLYTGSYALISEGYVWLGFLVLFCSVITPILVFGSIICAHWALQNNAKFLFQKSLQTYQHLKHWLMLDVFLISLAVAAFKLQEYATLTPRIGLACLILSQVFAIALVSRVSVRRYWEAWQSADSLSISHVDVHCSHCHLSQPETTQCVRCEHKIEKRKPFSVQKTWALLISAAICSFPANLLDISIIFSNGKRYEDTIFSGVVSLVKSNMSEIAIIIFVASILVPAAKIIGLAYILISIQLKNIKDRYQLMKLYLIVKWIGKWSILDLFVISITIALVDRDQILDFSPGAGAIAFALVVVFTMFAAESLDHRLIWDADEQHSTEDKKHINNASSTKPSSNLNNEP